MANLLSFFRNIGLPKPEDPSSREPEPIPARSVRLGLYPFGNGLDVIMTRALFDHIVHILEHGTPAERQALAFRLINTLDAREF